MSYKVELKDRFINKFNNYEQGLKRLSKLKKDLIEKLETNPWEVGTIIRKPPNSKYGFYHIVKSSELGKFPTFRILYRITDDKVEILDMDAIKF